MTKIEFRPGIIMRRIRKIGQPPDVISPNRYNRDIAPETSQQLASVIENRIVFHQAGHTREDRKEIKTLKKARKGLDNNDYTGTEELLRRLIEEAADIINGSIPIDAHDINLNENIENYFRLLKSILPPDTFSQVIGQYELLFHPKRKRRRPINPFNRNI